MNELTAKLIGIGQTRKRILIRPDNEGSVYGSEVKELIAVLPIATHTSKYRDGTKWITYTHQEYEYWLAEPDGRLTTYVEDDWEQLMQEATLSFEV